MTNRELSQVIRKDLIALAGMQGDFAYPAWDQERRYIIVLASCQRRNGHKTKINGKKNNCIFVFLAADPSGPALLSEPRNKQRHF